MITKTQRRLRYELKNITEATEALQRHLTGVPADIDLNLDVVRDQFVECYNAAREGMTIVDEVWSDHDWKRNTAKVRKARDES